MNVLLNSDSFFFTELIIYGFLGLAFGSFASALAYRIPQSDGSSPWKLNQRSACPFCGKTLGPKDLVPVFSWLLSRGRCQHCGAAISRLYPILEITAALLTLALIVSTQDYFWAERLVVIFIVPFLLALTVIDFRHKLLPNILILILAAIGFIRIGVAWIDDPERAQELLSTGLIGAITFGAIAWLLSVIMEKILKKPAMGMGDVKFFALAGLWLGLPHLGTFCILSGAFGVILGLIWKKIHGDEAFPFGPALIASFFIILCLQSSLLG